MVVSQQPQSGSCDRQGGLRAILAELQRRGAAPSGGDDGLRRRLRALERRLARVQALGSEYAQVDFSEHVQAILHGRAAAV